MIPFASVNWLAVVVGTVVSMAVGFLWYGPLFGNLWLRLIDKSPEDIESDPMDFLKTAVAAFLAMVFLNMVVVTFGAGSFSEGLVVGALAFVGVGATQTFVYTTFEGPKESVWLLFSAYQVVTFGLMGGVFAVWGA
jgi:hypothetical protein